MIQVKVHGLESLKTKLASAPRQIAYATALALTKTAKMVEEKQKREMRDVFDRPTPYTLSSTYTKSAAKDNLVAEVGLKNYASKATPAVKFLQPQVRGGSRRMKRFEKALQSVGAMPAGFRAVPGAAAQRDKFGNIKPSQIVQILSWFKAFPDAGYKANMSDKRRASLQKGSKTRQGFAYFAGRPGNRLPDGIWQRFAFAKGSAIKPVIIFVRNANYKAIYDFDYVSRKVADRELPDQINAAVAEALRTAR